MKLSSNNEHLKSLLKRYKLTHQKAAAMIGVETNTVDQWCGSPKTAHYRNMRNVYMQVFKIRLAENFPGE